MVARWVQALLGYHFSVLHRSARMMVDVDGLTRCFDKLSSVYARIASMLSDVDRKARSTAYTQIMATCSSASRLKLYMNRDTTLVTILTTSTITSYKDHTLPDLIPDTATTFLVISSVPIMFHSVIPLSLPKSTPTSPTMGVSPRITKSASAAIVNWLCIDNVCGYLLAWSLSPCCGGLTWEMHCVFSSDHVSMLFRILLPNHPFTLGPSLEPDLSEMNIIGMYAMFIPYQSGSILE